jgi:hypothetical protein
MGVEGVRDNDQTSVDDVSRLSFGGLIKRFREP